MIAPRSKDRDQNPEKPDRESVPDWMTEELIAETIEVWQPYSDRPLTREDAIEMLNIVGRLGEILEDQGP